MTAHRDRQDVDRHLFHQGLALLGLIVVMILALLAAVALEGNAVYH